MSNLNENKNNILVIGGPNVGKTHFGGQLYGRLNNGNFTYKIDPNNRPSDLTIFEDVLNKLYEGKRADHTEHSANRSIELRVFNDLNESIVFSFPDYAGEQVNAIVSNRQINNIWKEYIEESTIWMLFVRLDELQSVEDIITKGLPNPAELKERSETKPPVKISDVAFFVELLQVFLYSKKIPTLSKITKPKLTIILSCWDKLNLPENTLPTEVLKKRLPLFYGFINNKWGANHYNVLGLSSTSKDLTDEPDEDYIENTPVNFGYFINENGEKENDLTLIISSLVEKK